MTGRKLLNQISHSINAEPLNTGMQGSKKFTVKVKSEIVKMMKILRTSFSHVMLYKAMISYVVHKQ